MVYKMKTGERLNLKHPVGFNEKQNYLKIYEKHPEYSFLVDKIAVRDYIAEKIGKEYLFPIYGCWDRFEDIDFESLPNEFVLKCNHDSGSVKFIRDKNTIDFVAFKKFFNARLKRNPYYDSREYPYKSLKAKIIAEKYMVPDGQSDINDYKFFCFNGEPRIMFVATERSTDCRFDFYDMDFNHLDIVNIHPNSDKPIEKPELFEEMKAVAARLSSGMKFVRIDLYVIEGQIYFGEFTFFHGGGFWLFKPDEWEKKLGDWIFLSCNEVKK